MFYNFGEAQVEHLHLKVTGREMQAPMEGLLFPKFRILGEKSLCFFFFFKMTIITIEIFNRPLESLLPSAGAQSWCYKEEVHRQIARRRVL